MDTFDVADAQDARTRKKSSGLIWNILTVLVLLTTLCLASVIIMIIFNPNSSLNPFPPPTVPVPPVLPTATSTSRVLLQPSWTPTPEEVLPTKTPRPTNTPFITETPFGMPSVTPTKTLKPGSYNFAGQGPQVEIPSITFYPDQGCDWLGIGGQVLDITGAPYVYATVHLGGSLNGVSFDQYAVTGRNVYGDAGFEFKLADQPTASQKTLWIQLLDQALLPMSDKIYFDTYAECDKNLVIIYIKQIR